MSKPGLYSAMKNMVNNKSPGDDRLTKEYYETFWDESLSSFTKSVKDAKTKKESSVSQKQAVIKLIELNDRKNDT